VPVLREHGDGEKWYLQAANYAADLESDLARRGYVVSFINDFEDNRARSARGCPRCAHAQAGGRPASRASARTCRRTTSASRCRSRSARRSSRLATSVVRIPCLCRGQRNAEDGVCLVVTVRPVDDVLAEGLGVLRRRTGRLGVRAPRPRRRARAAARVRAPRARPHHLDVQTPFIAAICNCDVASGCMAMNLTLKHDIKVMWKGEWVARLAEEECTACGACVPACPFGALSRPLNGGPVVLAQESCWGCGTCRASCPNGALTLAERGSVPAVAENW
jgi:ferredoxin